jgi:phosphoserine phosphatase RsbU/P
MASVNPKQGDIALPEASYYSSPHERRNMIIALFADEASFPPVARRLEALGHACILAKDTIPGEVDCVVMVGDAGGAAALVDAAEEAGLPVLRLASEGAPQAAAAAAWGLGLADERYIEAARSDARVKRLEDIRVKMAEQRVLELGSANELLERQAKELKETLSRLDGANRQLIEELNLASELQKSLLPRSYPNDVPLEFAHKFIPLNSIGGDFFDVLRLDEKTLGMVIADVSGHGVGPALVTAMFKTSFGNHCKSLRSPSSLMATLNMELGNMLTTGHYVTAFAAIIDTETLELRYCSAGHPNQLIVKADGTTLELATMGFFLGMMPDMNYEEKSAVLDPGDTLVLFTDGVFESPDSKGEPFGREGIIRSIAARLGSGAAELSDGLFTDLLSWSQGVEASDDVTILMAQVIESL